jgi:hypothetical protein
MWAVGHGWSSMLFDDLDLGAGNLPNTRHAHASITTTARMMPMLCRASFWSCVGACPLISISLSRPLALAAYLSL